MTLPGGVFAETYAEDRALIRTPGQWIWFVLLLAGLVLLPLVASGRIIGIANVIGITLVAVIGLQITSGYAGQINMGQSAFMGVGGYVVGALAAKAGMPFWLTLPLGGIGAAVFGAVFGLAALRIKGFYLALTPIAAQYIFTFAMLKLPQGWFGRARSRTGRAFVAVRDNDNAAEVIGIDVFYYKVLAFFIGAFYAGIAGGLWAYYVRYVQADQFSLWLSVWYIGMLIVGGMGSVLGAIVGTVVIRLLQELITAVGPVLTDLFPQLG